MIARSPATRRVLRAWSVATVLTGALAAQDPVARGVAWLAEHTAAPEWTTGGLGNVGSKRLVTSAVCAYLSLLEPEAAAPARVPWEDSLRIGLGGHAITTAAFANWIDGLRALHCAEWSEREGRAHAALPAIVAGFAERQNRDGGWAHGQGMGVDFYPSTLLSTTSLALLALGTAMRHDVPIEAPVVADALQLLVDTQAGNGGFPYGGRNYRKAVEAGRTCGVLVALAAMRRQQGPEFARAVDYVQRNRERIPFGHASPAIHVLMGALGNHIAGDEHWQSFDESVLAKVRAAQRPDGSFADIVEGSPDSLVMLGDERTNTAYVTAMYTAALATPRARIATAWRAAVEPVAAPRAPMDAPTAATAWRLDLPDVQSIALDASHLIVRFADGRLHSRDPATGGLRAELAPSAANATPDELRPVLTRGHLLLVPWQRESATLTRGAVQAPPPSDLELRCLALATGEVIWSAVLPFVVAGVRTGGEHLLFVSGNGRVVELDRDTGRRRRDLAALGVGVNVHVTPAAGGGIVLSGESQLAGYDANGDQLWLLRSRAPRGLTPPAFAGLAMAGGSLYVGTTAGEVQQRSPLDGASIGACDLRSAPVDVVSVGDDDVLVLAFDGRLHRLRGQTIQWSTELWRHHEARGWPRLRVCDERAWASNGLDLVVLDTATGRMLARAPLSEQATWQATSARAVVCSEGRLECLTDSP